MYGPAIAFLHNIYSTIGRPYPAWLYKEIVPWQQRHNLLATVAKSSGCCLRRETWLSVPRWVRHGCGWDISHRPINFSYTWGLKPGMQRWATARKDLRNAHKSCSYTQQLCNCRCHRLKNRLQQESNPARKAGRMSITEVYFGEKRSLQRKTCTICALAFRCFIMGNQAARGLPNYGQDWAVAHQIKSRPAHNGSIQKFLDWCDRYPYRLKDGSIPSREERRAR